MSEEEKDKAPEFTWTKDSIMVNGIVKINKGDIMSYNTSTGMTKFILIEGFKCSPGVDIDGPQFIYIKYYDTSSADKNNWDWVPKGVSKSIGPGDYKRLNLKTTGLSKEQVEAGAKVTD